MGRGIVAPALLAWCALVGSMEGGLPSTAHAQSCNPSCPPGGRDARGRPCCPPRPPPPPPTVVKPPPPRCPEGKLVTRDTAGQCCWPGQAWAGSRCVGRPTRCPDGFVAAGEDCAIPDCPPGREHPSNSATACCWPGQAWSSARSTCIGNVERCPRGFEPAASGEDCVPDDSDRDGVKNAKDRCPDRAEDRDGFEDGDGCPEVDDDRDGVPDASDRCASESEDANGFEDGDGCPDEPRRLEAAAAAAAARQEEEARLAREAAAAEERERLEQEAAARAAQEARDRRRSESMAPRWFDGDGRSVFAFGVDYWSGLDAAAGVFDGNVGLGAVVLGFKFGFGNVSARGGVTQNAGVQLGVPLVSYPNWRGSRISPLNLDVGPELTIVNQIEDEGALFGLGPFLRDQAKLGPVVLSVSYRHLWLVNVDAEDDVLTFSVGFSPNGEPELVE